VDPFGGAFRRVLLVKPFPSGTGRITGNYQGPFREMGSQVGKNLDIVINQVSLGITLFLPEHLVQVGDGNLMPLYLYDFPVLDWNV